MKTSEKVKKKAFDKLRESSGSRESSVKAQQYLEGLLDIPFGIYKKEQILQFLDDFKNNIDSSLSSIKGKIDTLEGLKENVIMGRLIPAGTGLPIYSNTDVEVNAPEIEIPPTKT